MKTKPAAVGAAFLAIGAGLAVLSAGLFWRVWRSGALGTWVILGLIFLKAAAPLPEKRLFQEHILDPIPASVGDLKVDQPRVSDGYGYVFHFTITSEDLDRIIGSRPFERIPHVIYGSDGYLYYCGTGLVVYARGKEPEWFVRLKICGAEGHLYEEVKDRQRYTWVLVCNRDLGEAYVLSFKGDN